MERSNSLTLLGTGSVKGRPVYGCQCSACLKAKDNSKWQRRPASALLQLGNKQVLLDAGITHLEEIFTPGSLDLILLTHYHMDHIAGLYSLRWGENLSIPVTGPDDPDSLGDLKKHPGILAFSEPASAFNVIEMEGMTITPLPLNHSKPVLGYAFRNENKHLAYLTDTDGLPLETIEFLQNNAIDVMIIDCSYPPDLPSKPGSHNDLTQVFDLHQQIKPATTLLTHIGHDMDRWLEQPGFQLPDNVKATYDGQVISLD